MPTRRPQKAEPGRDHVPRGRAPADPLVGAGDPPHRRAAGAAAHPARSRHRLVAVAPRASGHRPSSPPQAPCRRPKETATRQVPQQATQAYSPQNITVMLAERARSNLAASRAEPRAVLGSPRSDLRRNGTRLGPLINGEGSQKRGRWQSCERGAPALRHRRKPSLATPRRGTPALCRPPTRR